ncbi:nucleoplasmin-like protein ANO39 [Macrosteles quadrilineatus]|uniref:nucleoplasmin-like protein ANO39 n=1 Tax=Macrosteles quadrilineatus TaxID=74068 RepID=UPI0023E20DDD|nr:nucleoplasmin-like protein ANO39 [Macrosteles quadrilineatus]
MTEDYFWGLTLSKDHSSEIWDPDMKSPGGPDANDSHALRGEHTLVVKQAVLGPKCTDGEVNVVQAEAMGYKSDIKFPIAVLKGGSQSQAVLDLLFPDPPVTFKLIQGNGPVHLLGNHSVGSGEMVGEDDEDDELEDELDEEDMDDLEDIPERNSIDEKKRKLQQATNSKPKSKKAKTEDEK